MSTTATGPAGKTLINLLERLKAAQATDGLPSFETRLDRIERAIGLLVDHKDDLADALREDFGHRSVPGTLLTDVAGSIASLKYARGNLRRWMRPERRHVTPGFLRLFGASARIDYQPKGVVGVVSPWNFPVQLTFSPLAAIFAAGCRAMVKPSEFVPSTSKLMAELIGATLSDTAVAVVLGGSEVGAAFTALPFDHLLYTGSTSVGRQVARTAAENLVPTTLELGGKCPVIVSRTADLKLVAKRVMLGKTLNAGQVCLAPDYVIVPQERAMEFVNLAKSAIDQMYPSLSDNPDYTSVINQHHYDRLNGYLADARAKGAEVIELNPAGEDFRQQPHHKMPPALILNPTNDMTVMQDEIFGPLLPVTTYRAFDEAIVAVNGRPDPLGLYYFGKDRREERHVLSRTTSGGVTVNDVLMHISMEDLPFGGVGASGMGAYHGVEGFRTFSHARAVYRQSPFDVTAMLRPPYGAGLMRILSSRIRR